MNTQTETYHQNCQITLRQPSEEALTLHLTNLNLIRQPNGTSECRLTLQASPELYQHISTKALFHLNPDLRGSLSNGDFLPDLNLQLEVTLQAELVPNLLENNSTAEAAAYLITLSQKQFQAQHADSTAAQAENKPETPTPFDPLLNTESWFCLTVKQVRDSGETGYSTFWNYVNPAIFNQLSSSSEQVTDGFINFIKDCTDDNLTTATEEATDELLKGVNDLFDNLENWIGEGLSEIERELESSESILETVMDFFTAEDWPFARTNDPSTLRLAFRGNNGLWTCYARVKEPEGTFVFYSICPVNAPETKRLAMAEFLTRANFGLVNGNFEMDFNDGEIRYKTGIVVKGAHKVLVKQSRLTVALLKQLVYGNVMMMDQYLPGIMGLLERDISPREAIGE